MRRIVLGCLLSFLSTPVWAAGFLDHLDGVPYKWRSFPIQYLVDQGNLGTIDNAAAATLAEEAFAVWAGEPTATISFANTGAIAEDVKGPGFSGTELNSCLGANYADYITIDDQGAPRNLTGDTLVIFDEDGSLFDCYLGRGASLYTLGVASAGTLVDSNMAITTGIVLINGRGLTPSEADVLQAKATVVHELGHMLNLAHTQLNHEEGLDSLSANDDKIPTMFPVLPSDYSQLLTLEADDKFSLGYLYPSASYGGKGFLSGAIHRRTGQKVRGVYVACRNAANPRVDAVSWISDQTLEGNGEYVCGGLGAGNYTVDIEPVFLAINYFSPDPPFIVKEFYSGDSEGFDPELDPSTFDADGEENASEIEAEVVVALGETTSGVDIVLNENGRLISGRTVSGTSTSFFPEWEYFIQVPGSASSLRIELDSAIDNVDLDLLVKCAPEFSQPFDSTALPLWDSSGGGQAEFASTGNTGNESLTVEGADLDSCREFHVLVPNYSLGRDTRYNLTATVSGANPMLSVRSGPGEVRSSGTGEVLVMSSNLSAQDDTFRVFGLTVAEEGTGDLAAVQRANLYLDGDGDGDFSGPEDRLLASTSEIDADSGRITFEGFDETIEDGEEAVFLLTYEAAAATAGGGWLAILLAIGLLLIRKAPAARRMLLLLVVPLLVLGSCSGRSSGFHPGIAASGDIDVRGLTFDDQVGVCVNVNSVKDFFECR